MTLPNFDYTLIALGSAVFSAFATILARPILKQINAKSILGINFLTMGAVLLLLSPLFYSFNATLLSVSILIIISLIDTAANYFYFKTFEKTEAGTAAPILSLAPAFTFIFSWIILGEGLIITWSRTIAEKRGQRLEFLIITFKGRLF